MSERICPIHGIWEKRSKKDRCPKCKTLASNNYDKYHRDKESKKIYDSAEWKRIRPLILARDEYKCVICGMRGMSKDLVVDHIKELRDGGDKYNENNLQTLCVKCHKNKTDNERIRREGGVKSLQQKSSTTEPPHKQIDKLVRVGTL